MVRKIFETTFAVLLVGCLIIVLIDIISIIDFNPIILVAPIFVAVGILFILVITDLFRRG